MFCYLQILNEDNVILFSKTPQIHFHSCSNRKQWQRIANILTLTTQWVILTQPIIALLAVVATGPFDVGFAATLSCDHPHVQVCVAVTHTTLQ